MCNRCLRNIDDKASIAEDSSMLGIEEEDDRSFIELINNTGLEHQELQTQQQPQNNIFRTAVQIKVHTLIKRILNNFTPFFVW